MKHPSETAESTITVAIHPRILVRHPWLNKHEVLEAWRTARRTRPRIGTLPPEHMALGWDAHGRLLEMIAYEGEHVDRIIYHVNIAQKRFLREMGLNRREIRELKGRR